MVVLRLVGKLHSIPFITLASSGDAPRLHGYWPILVAYEVENKRNQEGVLVLLYKESVRPQSIEAQQENLH